MQSDTSSGLLRIATPLVWLIVIGLALVRATVGSTTDLVADEAYYTMWSLFPSAGYLDHPPAIAWIIALGRLALGEGSLGVRIVAIVSPVLISLALYRTGILLVDRGAALLAVVWYNLSIGVAALSLLATPDVPSTLFWMLATWAVAEYVAGRNANWWLLVGLFAGLGVLGKYTNLFWGAGLVLFLLASRERWAWLKLWQVWAGGLIALAVVAPNLIWNAQNEWISFAFQGGRIVNDPQIGDILGNFGDLFGAQALFLGPVVVLFALVGLVTYAVAPKRWPGLAWPVFSILPALIYFAIHATRARVEANWLLPLWPAFSLLAAAIVLVGLRANLAVRIVRWIVVALQTLFGVAVTLALQWVIFFQPAGLEHLDRTRDMHGWTEVAQRLDALADERGAGWIGINPGDYQAVGSFASYNHFIGADRPVYPFGKQPRYGFLPIDPAMLTFPALIVNWTGNGDALAPYFGSVTQVETIERKFGDLVLSSYPVVEVDQPNPAFFDTMR